MEEMPPFKEVPQDLREVKLRQIVKTNVVKVHLQAFFPIVKVFEKAYYVDLWAGAGAFEYKKEEISGTAIEAIKAAVDHKLPLPLIDFILAEKNPDTFMKLLYHLQKEFRDKITQRKLSERTFFLQINKFKVYGYCCDSTSTEIRTLINGLDKNNPIFAFLDPYGWNVPMELVADILAFHHCDVLINIMDGFINRFRKNKTHKKSLINLLYRPDEDIPDVPIDNDKLDILETKARYEAIIDLYVQRLKLNGALYTCRIAFRGDDGQMKYHLTFAAKNLKALEAMKFSMWKAASTIDNTVLVFNEKQEKLLTIKEIQEIHKDELPKVIKGKFGEGQVSIEEKEVFILTETPFKIYKRFIKNEEGLVSV